MALLDSSKRGFQIRLMARSEDDDEKALERHAILLIDHGSRRSQANALLDEVATLVKNRLGADSIVEPAHMEIAEPTIATGLARCVEQGARRVIVHPFMLAPGRHVTEDLPRLIAAAAAMHEGVTFAMAAPLGAHSGVIDAVVERCQSARTGDKPSGH